jgi:phosphoserine phosphatase RsbU/P
VSTNHPALVRFGLQQLTYLGVAAVVDMVLWATQGSAGDLVQVLVYSLAVPNLVIPPLQALHPVFEKRRPPYDWLVFSALVPIVSVAAVWVSTALLFALFGNHLRERAGNPGLTFMSYLANGWKVPLAFTLIVCAIWEIHRRATSRLEGRARELEQEVKIGAAERESAEQELERAREIQQSLLPKEIPQVVGFEVTGTWEPARVVGGDYFDVLRLSDTKLAVCIADVVGKSVSAALLMANVQATVRAYASESAAPAWLCNRVNSVLCSNIAAGKFVTLFYGILDADKQEFRYANAGHPKPILVRANGTTDFVDGGGALLGIFPDWKYEESVLPLAPGDRLLLFTDGITEAGQPEGEEFGEESLVKAAREGSGLSPSELKAEVLARVKKFCNSKMADDATLIVVGVEKPASAVRSQALTTRQSAG